VCYTFQQTKTISQRESFMNEPRVIGGRFQLDHVIGQGGIGEVYYGFDRDTQEPVAVKALKSHVVEQDPKLLERFRREGAALKELDHPNIVKMLATIEDGGHHYLVMEYVSGGSLYDLLRQAGKLPIERVLYIALDLCDALTRAHRLKIIHRDIKPANVLLAPDGTPRLTDFGAARIEKLTNLTKQGSVIGTVSYLSPEACQGNPIDARIDIWAFGILLYEMLTGTRPFDRKEVLATILAIVKEPLPDLVEQMPDAPPRLVSLIYRMLEKDPGQRITSMRLVGAELESIIEHADSGIKQALDLIYRMLEREGGQSAVSMRVVGDLLGSTIERTNGVQTPSSQSNPAGLSVSQFEKRVAEPVATAPPQVAPDPAPAASQSTPAASMPTSDSGKQRQIIMGLAVLNIVQLVIIILLLL
jgi:serine/threonine protein kinase